MCDSRFVARQGNFLSLIFNIPNFQALIVGGSHLEWNKKQNTIKL